MNITHYSSPNYGSRCGWKPDVIVCHITDGAYEGAIETLCLKKSDNPVSSHFVVGKDGQVSQLVDIRNEAWCNGTRSTPGYEYVGRATAALVKSRKVNANLYSVSIECEGDSTTNGVLTDAQFTALVSLIQYIKQQIKVYYGTDISLDRTHILGHCEIAPKEKPDCPGANFPYDKLIGALNPVQPITHIDSPKGTVTGDIVVCGWAVAPSGIKQVGIYYDNNKPLKGIDTLPERPDVQKFINTHGQYFDALHSGYSYTIPHGTLKTGKHTIHVAGVAKDGSAQWASTDFIVK